MRRMFGCVMSALLLWLCAVVPGQAVQAATALDPDALADVLVAENALLLEVHVQGERLLDTLIVGYEGPSGILLPVKDIAKLLGYVYDEDEHVYSSELATRYGIDALVDVGAALLTIEADQPIPLVQRLRRERDWQLLASRQAVRPDPVVIRTIPYSLFDAGTTDFIVSARARRYESNDEEGVNELDLRGTVTGELLFMTALLDFAVAHEQAPRLQRFTMQRLEREPVLLGPLGARQLVLWDVVHPGLPLVTSANVGRGLFISNVRPTRSAAFDKIHLLGPLPAGWDVELYRDDILVDFRRADESGRYEFDDIVLYYGDNSLRLVFYGPYGEVFTEEYSYPVAQMLLPSGETYYQLSAGRELNGHDQIVARYGLALGPTVSADVGAARLQVGDKQADFAALGLQTLGRTWFAHAHAAGGNDGGRALDLGLRTYWGNTLVSVEQLMLWNFESRRFPRRTDPLVGRTTLALSGAWRTMAGGRVPTGVELDRSQLLSGRESWRLSHRIGTFVRNASVTNWLNWTMGPGVGGDNLTDQFYAQSLNGRLLLSKRRGRAGVMYTLGYRLHPDPLVETFGIDVESPFPHDGGLRLGISNSFETSGLLMSASLHREIGQVSFGVNASYDIKGEYRFGITVATGTVRNPSRGGWASAPTGVAVGGAAAVTVFLDQNANGVMDPGEQPLDGVAVLVDRRPQPTRTDADGVALLTRLSEHTPVTFEIDAAALPDIFWTPLGDGVSVVPRPGKVAQLLLPVVIRGEVAGATQLYEPVGGERTDGQTDDGALRPVSGVQLELVQPYGDVVGRTTSGFGGFYVFSDVLPGTYVVRVAPEQADRLGLVVPDTVVVQIDGGGSSYVDADVVLHVVAD